MQFTSLYYPAFLAAVAVLYYVLPKRAQNPVLLCASAIFYALNLSFTPERALWNSLLPAAVLVCSIVFTYAMARAIDAVEGAKRSGYTAAAVVVSLAVLVFFKYSGFILPTLLGITSLGKLGLPLGISFYTFTSVSYLVDVYRRDVASEKNFVRYAAFISFFGTITSGPILRAGKILPQLAQEHTFSYPRTANALRMMLVGLFRWVAVANVLSLFTSVVFEDVRAYTGGVLLLSAVLYALQLYFEFAGYSEIAQATGAILGLELPVNFNTPYFATNFSGFWNRWHITLSNWLNDYLFMPLVWGSWREKIPVLGKKWTKAPVLFSLFIVFLCSGFWHGNTWPFVVWGLLQAAYRIGEELLHRWRKPKKKPALPLRIAKTAGVFCLWSAALVFFRIGLVAGGTIQDACYVLVHQFSGLFSTSFVADTAAVAATGFYNKPIMVAAYFAFIAVVLVIGFAMDRHQCFALKGQHISTVLFCRPTALRWVLYWGFIGLILLAYIMQSGGYGSVSFAYANF